MIFQRTRYCDLGKQLENEATRASPDNGLRSRVGPPIVPNAILTLILWRLQRGQFRPLRGESAVLLGGLGFLESSHPRHPALPVLFS